MSVEPNMEIELSDKFARVTMSYTPDQLDALAQRVAEDWEQEVESSILSRLGYVRVVRCRDCEHYSEHEWILVTDVSDVCHFFGDGVKVEPDGFCAWGERRADG